MPHFKKNLKAVMERRELNAISLAKLMDKHPSAISNIINGSGNPKLSTLIDLASALNCSIDELANTGPLYSVEAVESGADSISQQVATLFHQAVNRELHRINGPDQSSLIDQFVDFWLSEGGCFNDGSQFADFVDVYYAPSATSPRLVSRRMGRRSAAAQTFGLSSTDQLNRELDGLPEVTAVSLASAQRLTVETNQPLFSIERLDIPTPTGKVSVVYKRLYTPWSDASGKYVINLSIPVTGEIKDPSLFKLASTPNLLDAR